MTIIRQTALAMGIGNAALAAGYCIVVFTEGTLLPPRPQSSDASGAALFLILWAIANAAVLFLSALGDRS